MLSGKRRYTNAPGEKFLDRWDPTLRCSALLAVLGLISAVAWFVTGALISAPEQPSCLRYVVGSCLFKTDPDRPAIAPPCAPEPCKFGQEHLRCPFAANGSFVRDLKKDATQECADPFMEGVRRPFMPPCTTACCSGHLPGGFRRGASRLPGAQQWQPRRQQREKAEPASDNCSYFQYTGAEVLHFLQRNKARILIAGDSMQKQLHGRLVHMFRGTRHPIDNRIYTMARYTLCRTADSYTIAPLYDKKVKGARPEPTLKAMPGFFGTQPHLAACSAAGERPVIIDSLFSAWFEWQSKQLPAYLKTLAPDEHLILVTGVNFLDPAAEAPREWMAMLNSIRSRVKVVIMSTPTGLIQNAERIKGLRHRNKAMQRWAAEAEGVGFLNLDAMTRDSHHPPHCVNDVHWMCWVDYAGRSAGEYKQPVPGSDENVLRDPRFGVPISSVYTTSDGKCHDELNRNVLMVLFNMFMKSSWSGDGTLESTR